MIHILNGDCLLDQFPSKLKGDRIVCRECLVDGDSFPLELSALFDERARYLKAQYPEVNTIDYTAHTKAEFDKIVKLPDNSEITLWFEDDVFWQVNFWFCVYLLNQSEANHNIFLARPPSHTPYGFGGLSDEQLLEAYINRVAISNPLAIASLWEAYSKRDISSLKTASQKLGADLSFIHAAVLAYIESIPTKTDPGRPTRSLVAIKIELQTNQFGPVFKAFCEREAIYGYGDLQVKKLYDALDT